MTVYPLILRVGPLELTGYGLMMMVAFLMAGWAIQLDLRSRKLDEEYAADIVIAGVIGGLVGAKIWYVLLTGDWEALLRRGGFVWYGGFLGATAAILFNSWRRVVPARFTAEICAAPLALGYALGRVGCFLVNDDYGMPSNLPWAMQFPKGLPETTAGNLARMGAIFPPGTSPLKLVAVHPTQLYETLLMMLAFWWLWRHRGHGRGVGWLFGWYLVFAGAERFLIEVVRAKDDRLLGPFTLAQATSVMLVMVGLFLVQRWREKDALSDQPSALVPKPQAS